MCFAFAIVAIGLVAQFVYLGEFERYFLQDKGNLRSERSQEIPVHRGMIFDRHGEPMAISTPVFAVTVNPSRLDWSPADMEAVAEALNLDPNALRQKLAVNEDRAFLYLARRQPAQKALVLQQLPVKGLDVSTEYRRYYPMGEVAAHLTGITDIDERGIEGLEKAFDDHLEGDIGKRRVVRDRSGRLIRDVRYEYLPKFGSDLTTSIDSRLQFLAYSELRKIVAKYRAHAASLILLDVPTGGILALANVPSYNPNDVSQRVWEHMRNRAVTDLVEPGSTYKPFVAIAALESGRYTTDTTIDTNPGWMVVKRKTIEDPRNYGVLSLRDVLVKSSQVGATRLALDLNENALLDVHSRIGFNDYVLVGLPGENVGQLSGDDVSAPIVRATMSYGYGFSVTPLQLANAYMILATGGVRRQISVLLHDERQEPDERILSEMHAAQVVDMLSGVVSIVGTANRAKIKGFEVAGKTGTVRRVSAQGYTDESHTTLFVGMVPKKDPQFLAVVVVEDPRSTFEGEKVSGGSVSAPVFSRVVTRALQLRGTPAQTVSTNIDSLDDAA